MHSHQRLRVLQIGKYYPPHRGGIESHLETLCRGINDHVDLRVIVSHDEAKTIRQSVDGVDVVRVGTWFQVASAPISLAMTHWIRRTPADIVHIHLPNPIAVLSYLASGHRGKLVMTYHSDVVRQKVLGAAFHLFLQMALARCRALIATSPGYMRSSPVLAARAKSCSIIPFGIPTHPFESCDPAARAAIHQRYGNRLVLSVGRHVYYKGFQYLIRAMRDVDASLLMIGNGPLRNKLEAEAQAWGVSDRVHFLGEVDDVRPYYHAADVFVLPSVARSEAFGIVQLEAMACGLPVINTSIPSGVPFVSVHEETGLTVPPGNAPELAAAIRRILDDNSLRTAFARAARQRVEREFRAERMAERTLALYHKVTERKLLVFPRADHVFIGG
jgi:rhamnosyl/mannosyltransferase